MLTGKKRNIMGILVGLSMALLLSACGGGGSGGSDSGVGSSSVDGNVVSAQLAMNQSIEDTTYSLAAMLQSLVVVGSAHASGGVDGITVDIAGMRTTTDGSGYFLINGVPPGNHQVQFSRNGAVSGMSVNVGENEQVTLRNVRIEGAHSRAGSVSRMPRGGGSGNPGTPGTPGNPGTPGHQDDQYDQGYQDAQVNPGTPMDDGNHQEDNGYQNNDYRDDRMDSRMS